MKAAISKAEAKARVEKLKKAIAKYRYEYHVLDKSSISPEALDSLKHELKKLEDEFPDLITPDSPTQRVAGKPVGGFKKITHRTPMLSLEDVFSEEEFSEWAGRVKKLLRLDPAAAGPELFCELKFDGLACSLVYKNGVLERASTRGDGKVGEDVTRNIRTIEAVPLRLEKLARRGGDVRGEVEVRGEVIITKKAFEKINREQKKKGSAIYANPRNLAAGSLRQLDPKITSARHLDFHAYDLIGDVGQKFHSEEHQILKELGFKTDAEARVIRRPDEVFKFKEKIEREREKLPYGIDGLVVQVDDNKIFQKLGVAGKAPRGSVAFKFSPKEATTRVKNVIVQVGRTGKLTPVAVLEPVEVSGVTISRASLHNEEEIRRLGLKIGDTVIVGRAGDVIPDVKKVLKELRRGREQEFHMPKRCPVCGHATAREKGGPLTFCKNKFCSAKHRENIYHFVSKHAFDIDGLGPKIVDVLLDQGLIQDAADIFDLTEGDIQPLERFGEKSAANIVAAVKDRSKISLPRFLIALGILHVGEETAEDLADHFGSLEKLEKANLEELQNIPNVGDIVAKSIYGWFRDSYRKKFLDKLLKRVSIEKYHAPSGKLKGRKFVVTGTLESLTREEAKSRVRKLGGDASETVSKETDYLVAGLEPGSAKLERAKKLGVKIIDEKEFLRML